MSLIECGTCGYPLAENERAGLVEVNGKMQKDGQEPIGEIVQAFGDLTAVSIPVMPPVGTKLYTAPPQREWVGLTQESIVDAFCSTPHEVQYVTVFERGARWAEAKLKEKNT